MKKVFEISDRIFFLWCFAVCFIALHIAILLIYVFTLGSPHGLACFMYLVEPDEKQRSDYLKMMRKERK